jgi:hypothetical protein
MPDMSTVFERSQRNGGFMTGPDHSTLGLDRMQNDLSEDQGPPNLREAEEESGSCNGCVHFMPSEDGPQQSMASMPGQASGMCEQFNTQVEPTQVCDAFEPLDEGGGEEQNYVGLGMGGE